MLANEIPVHLNWQPWVRVLFLIVGAALVVGGSLKTMAERGWLKWPASAPAVGASPKGRRKAADQLLEVIEVASADGNHEAADFAMKALESLMRPARPVAAALVGERSR